MGYRFKPGDRVRLSFGGWGGLNYLSALEDGYDSEVGVEIAEILEGGHAPYRVNFPAGGRRVRESDIKEKVS